MFSFVCCYLHFLCWHLDFRFFFLEKSFNWWFRMEYFYKEAISRSFITKKRFLALLLQRSNFSLFYSFGMPKKNSKIFIAFLDDLCQGDSESAKKKFEKKSVRPSVLRTIDTYPTFWWLSLVLTVGFQMLIS